MRLGISIAGSSGRQPSPFWTTPAYLAAAADGGDQHGPAAIIDVGQNRCCLSEVPAENVASAPLAALTALSTQSFAELIDFTRAGTATYIDADGLIKTAAADQPRFDHTHGRHGLLLEPNATNTALYSADFSQWTTLNATATAAAAPDGSTNAVLLVPEVGSRKNIDSNINGGGACVPGVQYTYSVFVKSAGLEVGIVRFSDRPNVYGGVAVDLHNGTVLDVGGGNEGAVTYAGSTSFGDGWWRIYFTHNGGGALDATNNVSVSGCPYIAGENVKYVDYVSSVATFDGSGGIYIWGVQREPGDRLTSYVPTAGSAVTRPADKAQLSESVAALLRRDAASLLLQGQGLRGASGRLVGGAAGSRLVGLNAAQDVLVAGNAAALPLGAVTTPLPSFGAIVAYDAAGKRGSYNGGAVAFDAVPMDANLTTALLGRDDGGSFSSVLLYQLVIWPFRMTDTDLQEKAAPYA